MKYYLLPILGQVEEEAGSAFRYESCGECGNSYRKQERDMALQVLQRPVSAFSTTMDGDLIANRQVAEKILRVETSVSLRSVSIADVEGSWFQVVPLECVELSEVSLRSPREYCPKCGGVARVQFGDHPPLVIVGKEGKLPHFARLCGAPLMTVFSSRVREIFGAVNPDFSAPEVLLGE